MFTFNPPPLGVNAILVAMIMVAAIYDIRYRRIPNWVIIPGGLAGIALNSFLYQGWPGLRLSLLGLAVGLGSYFILYMLHAMGAGDVKLMAAIGAMVGAGDWFGIFIITAIIGGFVGLGLVALRGRLKKTIWNVAFILTEMKSGRSAYLANEELDVRNPRSLGMPHGAVIALGTMVFLGLSAHFKQ